MSKLEIRLAGSGGQGIILATIILAEAAVIAGKNTAKVTSPDFLLALTQSSLDKFSKGLPSDCILMADSSLTIPEGIKAKKIYSLPILDTAKNEVGKAFTANMVAVAAVNAALELVPTEQLEQAVFSHIPKGTEEINRKALYAGEKLAKSIK